MADTHQNGGLVQRDEASLSLEMEGNRMTAPPEDQAELHLECLHH